MLQHANAFTFRAHLHCGESKCFSHPYDLMRRQGTGAHAALVAATVHLGFYANARLTPDIERADAFRAISLVRCQAHQVDRQFLDIDVHLPGRLCGIHVENDASFAAYAPYRLNVLDHADLIVDQHYGRHDGVGPQGVPEYVQIDQAIWFDGEVGNLKALAFELAHGVENGLVFGLGSDQVLASVPIKACSSLQRQIVGFCGA